LANIDITNYNARTDYSTTHQDGDYGDEEWTIEKLVDELTLCLASPRWYTVEENSGRVEIRHKYYHQAENLLYRIPVEKLAPTFYIYYDDLEQRIKEELEKLKCNPNVLRLVLKKAVGNIFEAIDFIYYHLSVARHLKVGFVKGKIN
jgi:hypothetical protein